MMPFFCPRRRPGTLCDLPRRAGFAGVFGQLAAAWPGWLGVCWLFRVVVDAALELLLKTFARVIGTIESRSGIKIAIKVRFLLVGWENYLL